MLITGKNKEVLWSTKEIVLTYVRLCSPDSGEM